MSPDDPPGVEAWCAWSPGEAATHLAGISAPWCVAGGWALDLWRGRQTRLHDDLEIAILRPQFDVFRRRFRELQMDLDFFAVGSGEVSALPASSEPPAGKHQVWLLERPTRVWRLDMFLEPGDADTWVCRRDEAIRRRRPEIMGTTADGVPYLKPEGVLLYKAKAARPKDEADFAASAPFLDEAARRWLKSALQLAHPGHRWIEALD
jgi:hypothetical protein